MVSSNLYQGEDNRYHIDFQDFEKKIVEENVKLFFLCNPHNPVGRVWSAEELEKLGDICVKNGVTVVSDEIHQDFVFKGKHQVFAGLKKDNKREAGSAHYLPAACMLLPPLPEQKQLLVF